ncbi:hypothetical protein Bca52824_043814, partial [Brassica carinata]
MHLEITKAFEMDLIAQRIKTESIISRVVTYTVKSPKLPLLFFCCLSLFVIISNRGNSQVWGVKITLWVSPFSNPLQKQQRWREHRVKPMILYGVGTGNDGGSTNPISDGGGGRVALKKGPWTAAEDEILAAY